MRTCTNCHWLLTARYSRHLTGSFQAWSGATLNKQARIVFVYLNSTQKLNSHSRRIDVSWKMLMTMKSIFIGRSASRSHDSKHSPSILANQWICITNLLSIRHHIDRVWQLSNSLLRPKTIFRDQTATYNSDYLRDSYSHNQLPSSSIFSSQAFNMTKPTSCCGRSDSAGNTCVCKSQAKCSCGKNAALSCNCEKAATENKVAGARWSVHIPKIPSPAWITCAKEWTCRSSCQARPAGECTVSSCWTFSFKWIQHWLRVALVWSCCNWE